MNDLEKKTASGFAYKMLERIGAKGIYFFVSIILARIITPDEYGIVSLVMVFIEICDIFVTHGFGSALIVKHDSDDIDFSTCFILCISLSAVLYSIILFGSDTLASFFDKYDSKQLSLIIKVMGLRIPIAAINTVQHAYIKKHMLFKKFFWATLVGTVVSGITAIFMAYKGFGVWALVEQHMGNILIDTFFVSMIIEWRPKAVFSLNRMRFIFNYGWKVLVVGLVDTGYAHIRSLVIGKKYSSSDLAYYSKGTTIPRTGVSIFEESLSSVFFPVIANCKGDKVSMVLITRKVINISTFLIFPIIIGFFVVGKELIVWMMTDKWIPSVIYLQIGCLAFLFRPIQIINCNFISASGKSDLLLKSDVINKIIGILLLVVFLRFGVIGVAISYAITNIISTILNIIFVNLIVDCGFFAQIQEIWRNLLCSSLMGAVVFIFSKYFFVDSVFSKLVVEIVIGIVVYIAATLVFNRKIFMFIFIFIQNNLFKKTGG